MLHDTADFRIGSIPRPHRARPRPRHQLARQPLRARKPRHHRRHHIHRHADRRPPTADADADGLNALLEYALGTSDTNNATGPTAYTITREPAGTFLFSHQRVLAADDLTYTLQATPDLTAAWTPATAAFVNSTPVAAGIVSDTWRITPPLGAVKFFVRLRVVR